jgi:hypothetical protein
MTHVMTLQKTTRAASIRFLEVFKRLRHIELHQHIVCERTHTMSMIFRTAAALGLSLEIAQNSLGHHLALLPEVTNPLAQLGLIFGVTFVLVELWDGLKTAARWFIERARAAHAAVRPTARRQRRA